MVPVPPLAALLESSVEGASPLQTDWSEPIDPGENEPMMVATTGLLYDTQPVVVFRASTKYVVVYVIAGVAKAVTPVPPLKGLPPLMFAYQSGVAPEDAAALSVTDPVPVLELSVVEVIAGIVFTVAITEVLVEVQPLLVAST